MAEKGQRSASQLDTIESMNQGGAKNDSALVSGGKNLANDQPIQFGFTNTAAMKQTLFSRMSPNNRAAGSSGFGDVNKIVRTQGSTGQI